MRCGKMCALHRTAFNEKWFLAYCVFVCSKSMSIEVNSLTEPISIIGAGGHGLVIASIICALANESYVEGIYDDSVEAQGKMMFGKVVKDTATLREQCLAVVAIGNNYAREEVVKKFQGYVRWATLIHPTAWISKDVELGKGSVVCAGAIVQPGVMIGSHVILNTGCRIDHHCKIADFSHIAPSCTLCGNVNIHEKCFIGASSVVRQGIVISSEVTVGCGGAVVKNIPRGCTVVGVPATPI